MPEFIVCDALSGYWYILDAREVIVSRPYLSFGGAFAGAIGIVRLA